MFAVCVRSVFVCVCMRDSARELCFHSVQPGKGMIFKLTFCALCYLSVCLVVKELFVLNDNLYSKRREMNNLQVNT